MNGKQQDNNFSGGVLMRKGAIMVGVSSRCRRIGAVLAIAGFMLLSTKASAACQAQGCFNVKVIEVYMNSLSAGFHVQTSGDETLANCTPVSGILLTVPENTPHFKELYALLLAAQIADKPVTIVINQETSPCTISYAKLLN